MSVAARTGFCEAACYVLSERRGSSAVQPWLVRFALGIACVLSALGASARAEPVRVKRARLTLGADPACATLAQLQARVKARDWQVGTDETRAELTLRASVQPESGDALRVVLRVDWADGRSAERSLIASHCGAALDALALLINMTLETRTTSPRARPTGRAERAPAPPDASRSPPSPAGAPEARPLPAAASGVPTTAEGPAVARESAADSGAPVASAAISGARSDDRSWFALEYAVAGALGRLGGGAAPRLEPGLGLYAALALRGSGLLRPLLQLQLSHAWTSGIAAQGGRADFTWDGGTLGLCPVGVRSWGLAAHGCAALELGRVRASGYDTYQPRSRSRPWLGAGAQLLLTAAPWQRLELQLGAALLHPFWRDQFAFTPQVFYRVPAVCFQLHLGLGLRFP